MTSNLDPEKNKNLFIEALKQTLGVVTDASEKCGIERGSHYRWMREDESYAMRVRDVAEMCIDRTESILYSLIQEKKEASVFFHLKCKGKHRGWVERTEIEHSIHEDSIDALK